MVGDLGSPEGLDPKLASARGSEVMSQGAAITCGEPPQRCVEKSRRYEAVVLSHLHSFAVGLGTLWAQPTYRRGLPLRTSPVPLTPLRSWAS
jgi:hypothetical protein